MWARVCVGVWGETSGGWLLRRVRSWRGRGGVWAPVWGVLERLEGVVKRVGAFLRAMWPDAENFENLCCSWERVGGVLERLAGLG